MNSIRSVRSAIRRFVMARIGFRLHQPPPMQARDWRYSVIASLDDEAHRPTRRLVTIAAEAAKAALDMPLDSLADRELRQEHRLSTTPRTDVNLWPGEHYRLLAALVKVAGASNVVEVGTHRGLSALAIREALPEGGVVTTFDIKPWNEFMDTCLTEADLADGRIAAFADDLCLPATVAKHRAVLEQADLLFIDGPHDGDVERRIMANLQDIQLKEGCILIFDDIRLWDMLSFWRELPLPKLDITSFGHWSGTGLAEWRPDSRS
jgi:predicted O-methyltransferase YrrM